MIVIRDDTGVPLIPWVRDYMGREARNVLYSQHDRFQDKTLRLPYQGGPVSSAGPWEHQEAFFPHPPSPISAPPSFR